MPCSTPDASGAGACDDATSLTGGQGDGNYACALRVTAQVACWGFNSDIFSGARVVANSATPKDVAAMSDVVSVAGGGRTRARSRPPVRWGYNASGQLGNGGTQSSSTPVAVQALDDATAISAGNGFSCALRASAATKC